MTHPLILSQFIDTATETATKVADIIDRVSVADNRWLFICSQVLLIVFAALVIWFLVRRSESSAAESRAERSEIRSEMERERERFTAIIDGYRDNLGKMSSTLEEINLTIAKHDLDMRATFIEARLRQEITKP